MSYAPHTNRDARQSATLPVILGAFVEADFGQTFEFAQRRDDEFAAVWPEFPHIVYVHGGTRYARVLKSVAYVVVDEAEDGSPVVEKWATRRFRQYTH